MLILRTILRRYCQVKRSFSDGGGSKMVRVRFAPSPTGPMHLGGLRTALYNYLFARSHGGKFILRIEDTDRLRTVPGAADQIERVLDRFGLERDEGPQESGAFGPYRQSERLHHYRHAAEQLIEADAAYPCFCTEQRIDLLRRTSVQQNQYSGYDNRCRSLDAIDVKRRLSNGESHVIRFKLTNDEMIIKDLVYDDLVERCLEGDCIIIKTDGYPTYHFANVVDDHLQQISHVLRGVEWRLSTNKHLQIYRAFQWTPPTFAHLPLLLSASGKHKLSKRNPSALIDFYSGYLPLAVINYLLRNGSGIRNYDAHKIYTIDELIAQFDIKCISTRPLNIDNDALDRYGRLTFANVDIDTVLIPEIRRQIANDVPTSSAVNNIDYMRKVAHFLRQNEEGFSSLTALTTGKFNFMFKRVVNVDNCLKIASVDDIIRVIDATIEILRTSISSTETIDRIRSIASNDDKLTKKTVFHLLRYALIDSESGPPIHELIEFFGPDECIKMLHHVKSLLHK